MYLASKKLQLKTITLLCSGIKAQTILKPEKVVHSLDLLVWAYLHEGLFFTSSLYFMNFFVFKYLYQTSNIYTQ